MTLSSYIPMHETEINLKEQSFLSSLCRTNPVATYSFCSAPTNGL